MKNETIDINTNEVEVISQPVRRQTGVITDIVAQQIVVLYEQHHITPEDIAGALEIDVTLVKVALNSHSSVYRVNLGKKKEDINDDEYEQFLLMYKEMAIVTDDPSLKERMLWKLMQEKKGRNDPKGKTVIKDKSMNITQFNTFIQQTREKLNSNG